MAWTQSLIWNNLEKEGIYLSSQRSRLLASCSMFIYDIIYDVILIFQIFFFFKSIQSTTFEDISVMIYSHKLDQSKFLNCNSVESVWRQCRFTIISKSQSGISFSFNISKISFPFNGVGRPATTVTHHLINLIDWYRPCHFGITWSVLCSV